MTIQENYQVILEDIKKTALQSNRNLDDITLIAVTKNYPLDNVIEAHNSGCLNFGENRIDEALEKIAQAPKDLQWHLIGSLQSKKVNKVIGKFSLIHSVDTPRLATKISEASLRQETITSILLQANTSGEESKHGMNPNQWKEAFPEILALQNIEIQGFMTMAQLTDDEKTIRDCFANLRILRDDLVKEHNIKLPHLSMGMSHDYHIAIQEGATLLRIGTLIFRKQK